MTAHTSLWLSLLLALPAAEQPRPRTLWTSYRDYVAAEPAKPKADPPGRVAPPEVTIPEAVEADPDNYDAFVPLTTTAKVLAWRIPKASGIRVLPQYNPGETIPREFYLVRCKKQGEWEFIVSGVAGEKLTQSVCIITVGTPVPPTPPVPPGPTPPTPPGPADPLTAAMQAAYAADTDADKAKSLAFLAAAYKGMAASVPPTIATNADLVVWMRSVVEVPVVGLNPTQVVNLRKAIGAELAAATGATRKPLSSADAAKELQKIADALGRVK